MQKKSDGFPDFSVQEAMRLAKSDAGQQLLAFLQSTQGDKLQNAMEQAAAGNMEQVKKAVQELMGSDQAQHLLQKMQGDDHG